MSAALAPALRRIGHDLCLVTSHGATVLPDETTYEGVPLHRLHMLTALTQNSIHEVAASIQRLTRIKRSFRPDLVHVHFSGPSALFHWKSSAGRPIPTVVTLHALHSVPGGDSRASSLVVQTLEKASWVVSVSRHLLSAARELVPSIGPKSSVIYNGMARPDVAPAPLPIDPPLLLCVGRLVPWKGFGDALRAFAQVQHRRPDVRMVIAGDGPHRRELEQLASGLGVGESVRFEGRVEPARIPALLNRATLLLIPSWREENLPMTSIEAAWMGRPVVASDLSGLPEIVRDGETGLLVPPNDPDALAARLVELLAAPERLRRMGDAAHRHVVGHFDLDRCADAYDQLYRIVAARGAA